MEKQISRRQFLKKCRDLSLLVCGSLAISRNIADGFIRLAQEPLKVVFIQGQNCLGCTISMTYGNEYDFSSFIQRVINLQVHPALSFNQGESYISSLKQAVATGGHILVIEGSIPVMVKTACYLGEHPLADVLADYAKSAKVVICSGTCASHGGIPASGENELGVISATKYLQQRGVTVPVVPISGCPVHPDHLMGTMAYIASTGNIPPTTKTGQPAEYFDETIHNRCARFQHFTQDNYLTDYNTEPDYCLLKQGCRGPVTYSDCSSRRWNGKVSYCIDCGSPCVGCKNKDWPYDNQIYLSAKSFEDIAWSAMKNKTRKR